MSSAEVAGMPPNAAAGETAVSPRPGDRWLSRVLLGGALLVGTLLIALDLALERSPGSLLPVLLCGAAVVWLLTRRARLPEREPERTLARILVPLACLLRLGFLAAFYSLEQANGLNTVGLDAGLFLRWGRIVAAHLPTWYDITPYHLAGTYDIGFHYFLGLALWALGGNLLAVHTILAFAGTFGCFLLWQVSRPLLGDKAVWPAFLLAVSPLGIYLASSDLMKDALLTFFFLLTLWAAQQVLQGRYRRGLSILALVVGFTGARLIRAYVGMLLEAGVVGIPLIISMLRRPRLVSVRAIARPLAIVALLFGSTEAVLMIARQPPVAKQIVSMGLAVPQNDQLLSGPLGSVERSVFSSRGEATNGAETLAADWTKIPSGFRQRLQHHAFDIVRRTYGPFLWSPVRVDHLQHFLIGNWSSYLDSVLWYWAWPFGLCGAWLLIRRRQWDGWFVAAVVVCFSALLLIFHISYRQRGSNLMPLLLTAACFGWLHLTRRARRAVLLVQGSVLVVLAAGYWILRSSAGL